MDPNASGVIVSQVMPGSPAQQAGLQAGDQILEVNGQQVNDPNSMIQLIGQASPEQDVNIRYLRNGQVLERQVRLMQAPPNMMIGQQGGFFPAPGFGPQMGFAQQGWGQAGGWQQPGMWQQGGGWQQPGMWQQAGGWGAQGGQYRSGYAPSSNLEARIDQIQRMLDDVRQDIRNNGQQFNP
jgi:hypothetical protein